MAELRLASVLDLPAAAPLRAQLLGRRGADLDLDAGDVERLGGLCLQVLFAARRTWVDDGAKLRLINVSEPCRDALHLAHAWTALGMDS